MELDYDGDTEDPRQYCQHGTFIGSWWGPDYMCGACEMGYSVAMDQAGKLRRAVQLAESHPMFMGAPKVADILASGIDTPYSASVATLITSMVLDQYDNLMAQMRYIRRCKARLRLHTYQHREQLEREMAEYE